MSLNVSLTPHLEQFVHETVHSGRFQSASEVVRTALRLLEEQERERQARLDWLRGEIQKGLDSGPSEPVSAAYWDQLRQRVQELPPAGDDA
jgi:antitoxin ParD1/3/4